VIPEAAQAMTPDVAVIIPAFNSVRWIGECLDSVFAQTLGQDRIEIFVVDDGSTDGTAEEIDRIASEHDNVRVFHQANSGSPSGPRNLALDHATARYVFFLDSDDRLNTESLERMVHTADRQGSDVVLGRQLGTGGRRPPKSMFTRTQLSTDVFHSRAWWFMNPMKLFRRAMIEEHGLRFPTDHRFAEDQPFSGHAYLAARVISILADYDYIFFSWRDDATNITLSQITVLERLQLIRKMLALVADNVEAGPNRDLLLKRHFEMEFFSALRTIARTADAEVTRSALEELAAWVHELYSYEVVSDLSPAHRIAFALLASDDIDRLATFMLHVISDPTWSVHHEGDRVFADYPYFRDTAAAVPDACYDVTARIKPQHHLDVVEWRGETLHIEGAAYLDVVPTDLVETELLLSERDGEGEYVVPVTRHDSEPVSSEAWRKPFTYERTRFSADIEPGTLAGGGPLGEATWDVRLRMRTGLTTRSVRIGCRKDASIDQAVRLRLLGEPNSPAETIAASYFTDDYGNLSLDVGPTKYRSRPWFQITEVSWDPAARATLHLAGHFDMEGLNADRLGVALEADGVGRFELPVTATRDGFTAEVPLLHAADGRRLPRGLWTIAVEAHAAGRCCTVGPRPAQPIGAVYAWRGVIPDRITLIRRDGRSLVWIERLAPVAALRRRIARALKR